MENSYRFFENKECQYYPCHKGIENMNCLFCYCPLYSREHCPRKTGVFRKGRQADQGMYKLHISASAAEL